MRAKINRPSLRWSPAAAAALLVLASTLSTASAAPQMPAAAKRSPGEPGKARLRTLDVEGLGGAGEACTDFYQYADAGWLAKNPIPADRPRWGSFDELRQRNQNDLRAILERLAAIETKGIAPIQTELARIEAIRDAAALREEIARLQSMGVNALFAFGSEEDRKDSSRVIAAALQAGLGLPARDYDPAAPLLLSGRGRRDQLRLDRRSDRPRDHPRLRQLRPEIRREVIPGRLLDRRGCEEVRRGGRLHRPAVRRLFRRARGASERRARSGGGDRGSRRVDHRVSRLKGRSLEGKPEPAPTDGLTADQRFFVANARLWASNHRPEFARLMAQTNEHPLGKFRAIGTVSNMPEFARAFQCPPGAAMVRSSRCRIW